MTGDLREFVPFTGTRVVVKEGSGTEADPHRLVTYWYDENGTEITRADPVDDPPDDPSIALVGA